MSAGSPGGADGDEWARETREELQLARARLDGILHGVVAIMDLEGNVVLLPRDLVLEVQAELLEDVARDVLRLASEAVARVA